LNLRPPGLQPAIAPDRLSVWPIKGGRYRVDGTYQGATALGAPRSNGDNL